MFKCSFHFQECWSVLKKGCSSFKAQNLNKPVMLCHDFHILFGGYSHHFKEIVLRHCRCTHFGDVYVDLLMKRFPS